MKIELPFSPLASPSCSWIASCWVHFYQGFPPQWTRNVLQVLLFSFLNSRKPQQEHYKSQLGQFLTVVHNKNTYVFAVCWRSVPSRYSQDHKKRGKGGPQNILTTIKNQQLRSKILFVWMWKKLSTAETLILFKPSEINICLSCLALTNGQKGMQGNTWL